MKIAPRPLDEEARLSALRAYDILDTAPEPAFDRLTRLSARLFNVPIALVSLVDHNRQWFKSCYGLGSFESSRDSSFCAHAILADEPLVIPDAALDDRFADNPLVAGEPHIRFYAGAPITSSQGYRLGTVCIIDSEPHPDLSLDDRTTLRDLAALASEELELRNNVRRLSRLEQSLRTSEERFDSFMRHSPAIAFIKDAQGRMLYVNEAAEKAWNIKARDWLGKLQTEIWPAAIAERIGESDREVWTHGPQSFLEQVPGPEGVVRQLLSLKFPFEDAQHGRLLGVMSIDISEQKRLEEQLRTLNGLLSEESKRAEEASRLKSQFLANMSHELRTPLNGIIGFSELLVDGRAGELTPRQQRFLENVLLSSQHLLRLINDLLDLAKIEAGKLEFNPELVSATSIIQEVVSSQQVLADAKQIRLTYSVETPADELFTDPVRLKQIVFNFVSNAIKFTPEQGAVDIRGSSPEPDLFRLEVSDTGIGIEEKDMGRLFQDFEQLDAGPGKRFAGTGLGLALLRKLVTSQGGSVECTSVRGKGSTFSAVLPRRI